MRVEDWLGKDNKLGQDIWYNKYRHESETFEEWLNRITDNKDEYKQLILEKKFLPAGRILSNRGLHKQGAKVTYSNCYVLRPPEDNIESIFETAKEMARTFSYGGGVGIDISKLAPNKAKVNNTAKETSGAVSFMDLYSLTTGLIGQNGRRGALMISLNCDHPDIEQFIEIKSDLDKVTKANISIKITDKFMQAVENDSEFKLSFTREETGEVIEKIIKAKELYKKFCYMNWDYAEPGLLFWDRISKWNLLSNNSDSEYAGTNPCIIGDTLIETDKGKIPIIDLVGTTPLVQCIDGHGNYIYGQATKVWKTRENAELVGVYIDNELVLKCTPDHRILTDKGYIEAQHLKPMVDTIQGPFGGVVSEIHKLQETQDVYDMTVENWHNFVANGIIIHNCAEEP